MKIMSLIILGIIIFSSNANAQREVLDNYKLEDFNFIGYRKNKPIYISGTKLYYPIRKDDGIVNFMFFTDTNEQWGAFINDDIYIYEKAEGKDIYLNKDNTNNGIKIDLTGEIELPQRGLSTTKSGDTLILSTYVGGTHHIAQIDLTQINPKMEILPIKGFHPQVEGEWIFYAIEYLSSKYSEPQYSIYRVKIRDLRSPELIIDDILPGDSWSVIDENNIYFKKYHDKSLRNIIYNVKAKRYAEINEEIGLSIFYGGRKYQRKPCKNKDTWRWCYEPYPELSDNFFQKELLGNEDNKNENYLHLPHSSKQFYGTFITDTLMFSADRTLLSTFTKEQLRYIRNAFYAREGYIFQSKDLNDFFYRFDWYKKLIEARKNLRLTNEDILIPDHDKERISLIREIENNK